MTDQRVVILGEARVDELRDAGGMRESVTGDAVELATALLGHGLALTIVAPVGEDADGERIRTALADRGIRLVALTAAEGTPRRSIVHGHGGAESERRRGTTAFADTRRSLAAQSEADVIVDLRDREVTTIAEERDEVLRVLGLSAEMPAAADADRAVAEDVAGADEAAPGVAGDRAETPEPSGAAEESALAEEPGVAGEPAPVEEPGVAGESVPPVDAPAGGSAPAEDSALPAEAEPVEDEPAEAATDDAAAGGEAIPVPAPRRAAGAGRLLPAPLVAGTLRNGPVRLLPEPPVAHAPAPDWHGLETRLTRIAT